MELKSMATNNLRITEITNKNEWNKLLKQFDDANIYQTWGYAALARDEKFISHVAIYEDKTLLGISQVRIKKAPIINWGIAYIYRGPLWQKSGQINDIDTFKKIVSTLKHEFLDKKKLLLRLKVSVFSDLFQSNDLNYFLEFNSYLQSASQKTLVLYLDKDLESIRKSFTSKWRNRLNQSEKNGVEVVSGYDQKLFDEFLGIYDHMIARKKFDEKVNPRKINRMNQLLDPEFKLKIFMAYKDKQPTSALAISVMGNTGVYLLGANNELGMQYKSAYLLQWEVIKWLKLRGILRYDLGGIDLEKNPGVFEFKSGITKNEVKDLGTFEFSNSKLLTNFVHLGDLIRLKF